MFTARILSVSVDCSVGPTPTTWEERVLYSTRPPETTLSIRSYDANLDKHDLQEELVVLTREEYMKLKATYEILSE